MAQTIQIKRSTGSTAPTSLANGELAYLNHSSAKKLYIGRPGGGTGDIDTIGGKDFTDKLDLIGAPNGTSAADARVVSSATNLGVIRIGSGLSIATTGIVSADNQVTTSAVSGAGALMTTGGTMSGNIVFGDNNKLQLGGTSTNLEIYNDGTKSYITETATGNLIIKATDFEIHDGGGQTMVSFDADGSLRLYDQSATNGIPVQRIGTNSVGVTINGQTNTTSLKFGNETVIVSSVKDEDDMNSDSATALATQQSIKKYVDDSTATAAVAASGTSLATGDQIHTFVNAHTGNFDFNGSTLELVSGGTMTLGASDGSEPVSIPGTLTVSGNLNVNGDVNSVSTNNLDVTDKLITVGVGQSGGAAASGSGLKVFGDNAFFAFNYDSTPGTSQFEIDEGDGTFYPVLHTGNSATQTYTIDAGTF